MAPHQMLFGVACLALALPLAAQADVAQQAEPAVDTKSRVSRVLKSLLTVPSFECATKIKAKASPFMRGLGGGKTQTSHQKTVKEADTLCWSKSDGDEVLAHRMGRWVLLDRDGDWIPCRKPQGPTWGKQFLADPVFFADRLLHLLPKTKWETAGADTLNDKAVRVYKCKVDLDEANHLVRTGALPDGGGVAGAIGRAVIMVGGAGGAMRMPEAEREIEIELYEDPTTRMPLKIVARTFEEGGAMGGMRIAVQGIGGAEEEEEEEEGEKKKKPAYTLTMELSKIGDARARLLARPARKILGQ